MLPWHIFVKPRQNAWLFGGPGQNPLLRLSGCAKKDVAMLFYFVVVHKSDSSQALMNLSFAIHCPQARSIHSRLKWQEKWHEVRQQITYFERFLSVQLFARPDSWSWFCLHSFHDQTKCAGCFHLQICLTANSGQISEFLRAIEWQEYSAEVLQKF